MDDGIVEADSDCENETSWYYSDTDDKGNDTVKSANQTSDELTVAQSKSTPVLDQKEVKPPADSKLVKVCRMDLKHNYEANYDDAILSIPGRSR